MRRHHSGGHRGHEHAGGRGHSPGRKVDDEVTKARAQFQALDKNRDGKLSIDEIRGFLKKLNRGFSENQVQRLFCEIDANQNGTIELKEFTDYIFEGKKSKPEVPRVPPRGAPSSVDVREEWKQATLDAHNVRRALHGSPDLTWSDECYIEAKKQADACQAKSSLFHGHLEGPSGRHGQNAYWSSRPGSDPEACTKAWYDELIDPGYDFSDPGFKGGTGHFTQVVWKGTTQVGMAASEDGCFVVANYLPPGNFSGRFPENVLPASGSLPEAAPKAAARAKSPSPRRASPAPAASGTESAAAPGEVKATSMTPELEQAFAGCPFPFKDEVATAFADGGATVTVKRSCEGRTTKMTVIIETAGCTSEMRGSWGGG